MANIKKISIKGLFGYINYSLNLNEDLNLMIAPNGFGKTTSLFLAYFFMSFGNRDFFGLKRLYLNKIAFIPFETISIIISENRFLKIDKCKNRYIFKIKDKEINEKYCWDDCHFTNKGSNKAINEASIIQGKIGLAIRKFREKANINFMLFNSSSRQSLVSDNYVCYYYRPSDFENVWNSIDRDNSFYKKFGSESIIEYYNNDFKEKTSFLYYFKLLNKNQLLSKKWSFNQFEYLRYCALDIIKTIVNFVVENKHPKETLSFEFIRLSDCLEKFSWSRRFYAKYIDSKDKEHKKFISDKESLNESFKIIFEKKYNQIIDDFVEDVERINKFILKNKININELEKNIKNKINLFSKLVNSLKFYNKKLKISKNGFEFYSNSKNVDINFLSSGEKNLIILIYELVFVVKNHSVIFIDEPENSLHINWQLKYIDLMLSALEKKTCQIVISTHSPEIIGKYSSKILNIEMLNNEQK